MMPSYATISGAVYNLVVLLGLTFLVSVALPYMRRLEESSRKLAMGIAFGGIAIGAMTAAFELAPGVIVDLRNVAVLGAAIFSGPKAAIIAAAMAAAFRLSLGGFAWAGILLLALSALLGSVFSLVWVRRGRPVGAVHYLLLGVALALLNLAVPPIGAVIDPENLAALQQAGSRILPPALIIYPIALLLLGQLISREQRRLDDRQALERSREEAIERARELERTNRAYIEEAAGRHRTEEALRESEALLSRAQRMAGLGHWIWHPDGKRGDWQGGSTHYSAAAADVLGIAPGTHAITNAAFLDRFVHPDDRAVARDAFANMVEPRFHAYTLEYRVIRADGTVRTINEIAENVLGEDGYPVYTIGTLQDVTGRKAAESALRASEALKRTVLESALDAVIAMDEEGLVVEFNPAAERIFGFSRAIILGKPMADFIIPERYRAQHRAGIARWLAKGEGPMLGRRIELTALRADGGEFPVELAIDATMIDGRTIFTACLRDIAERKRSEEALRESESMLRRAQRIARLAHWVATPDAERRVTVSRYSDAAADIFGVPLEQLVMTDEQFIQTFVHPEDRPPMLARYRADLEELARTGRWRPDHTSEYRVVRPDGEVRVIREVMESAYDADGGLLHILGTVQDVTEQKRAEAALRESEAQLRHAQAIARLGHWISTPNADHTALSTRYSPAAAELIGVPAADLASGDEEFMKRFIHPDDYPRVFDSYRRGIARLAREGRWLPDHAFEYRVMRPDGELRVIRETKEAVYGDDGRLVQIMGTLQDVTEARRTQAALRESEERFGNLADTVPALVWMSDVEGNCIFLNKRWLEYTGRMAEEELGHGYYEDFHADQRADLIVLERDLFANRKSRICEYKLRGKDGVYRWFLDTTVPRLSADGTYLGHVGVLIDIDERRRLEEQLRQAQKMEAIGQLTGGIAHDFNNLLTVILGNLELIQGHASDDPRVATLSDTALQAAERGAELVQRLLAFSRRQALMPREVGLNALVTGMTDLLRSSLGDGIEIETRLAAELWSALVDPAQVENALLNLAINARDAMPNGGRLLIETANAVLDRNDTHEPDVALGDYVLLSVSDTGIGMPPEVMQSAVEPFFTTKEVGKGTGLGLSMVYGFAKQSGGHLRIGSVEGKGTTIRLYLPRLEAAAAKPPSSARGRRRVRSLDAAGS